MMTLHDMLYLDSELEFYQKIPLLNFYSIIDFLTLMITFQLILTQICVLNMHFLIVLLNDFHCQKWKQLHF